MTTTVPTMEDLADIQGNILRAYGMPYARYLFIKIGAAAAAKALLGQLAGQITPATPWDTKPLSTLNLALSYTGLKALGLPAESLASFPAEFQAGMAQRASVLGDTGRNDPTHWSLGGATMPVDGVFILNAQTLVALQNQAAVIQDILKLHPTAVQIVTTLDSAMLDRGTEHFGFNDGFGQPDIAGSGAPVYPGDGKPVAPDQWRAVQTGEFVLGYPDESSYLPTQPAPVALGRNSSFMVLRKLEQNVVAFRTYLQETAAAKFNGNVELLAAKLVGRWRSGCPLVLSPLQDNETIASDFNRNNDFRYAGDPQATSCPFGSHLRRVNPRDDLDNTEVLVQRHRIVRRGLPYGTWLPEGAADDGQERGIVFIAINASIARQFEFVQGQWVNSGSFTSRMDTSERDPLASSTDDPADPTKLRVPVSGNPPVRLFHLPDFVTVKGGEYFYLPSRTAIHYLANL